MNPIRTRAILSCKIVLLNALLAFSLLETALAVSLTYPSVLRLAPTSLIGLFRYAYMRERSNIQFDPACARYDAHVTYTLKPWICSFSNHEFTNEFRINSAGLRDDVTG